MSLEDLLNVEVVAASKKPELESEAPAVVQVITAREIAWLGFNTLEQVLEYAVGLSSVNGEGNTFTTTTVRGNTLVNYQTNTLLLLDGVPIYRPYDGSFDFLAIPLSSIKQIEIVKGSNSVLYGTNAISAVIDIRTKDKDTASVLLRLGRFNTMHSEAAFYKKYDDGVTASVFVDSTQTTGEQLIFHDEKNQELALKKSLESHAVIATLGYKGFYGRVQQFERDAPSVKTRGFNVVRDPAMKAFTKPEQNEETGWLVTAGYAGKLNKLAELSTRLSYYQWRLDKDVTNGIWHYSAKQLQGEADVIISPTDWTSVTVGTQLEYQKARRFQGDIGIYDVGKDDRPTYTAALYANGEVKLQKMISQPVSFFYGARYYFSDYIASGANVKQQNLSPRAAIVYKPHKTVVVKGIFGQSFRAPTYFEKEASSAQVQGNPELKPERSTSFDLAATYKHKYFNINVNLFHQTINDKITRVRLPMPDTRSQNQNIGDVTFDGVEAWGKFQITNRVEGFFGQTFVFRAKQDAGDGMGATDFKFSYDRQSTLGFLAKVVDNVGISASAKRLSRWEDAAPYTLLNAQAMYDVTPQLQFALSAHNILGTDVELPEIARDADSVPTIPKTEGTTVFGTMSYTF